MLGVMLDECQDPTHTAQHPYIQAYSATVQCTRAAIVQYDASNAYRLRLTHLCKLNHNGLACCVLSGGILHIPLRSRCMFDRYPYSVTGIDMNNNIFSRASVESINTVLGDAAGCMLAQSEGCGNFQTDGDEDCDCGGSTTSCAALKDTCCSSGCKFVGGATCSPLDRQHGACCKDDCTIQVDVTCIEQSVCQKAAECSVAGKCPDTAVNRPENAICQQEVAICATGRCSGLCDANGGCTKSICELWGKEECDPGRLVRQMMTHLHHALSNLLKYACATQPLERALMGGVRYTILVPKASRLRPRTHCRACVPCIC